MFRAYTGLEKALVCNSCDPQGIESLIFLRLQKSLVCSPQTNAPDLAKNFKRCPEPVTTTYRARVCSHGFCLRLPFPRLCGSCIEIIQNHVRQAVHGELVHSGCWCHLADSESVSSLGDSPAYLWQGLTHRSKDAGSMPGSCLKGSQSYPFPLGTL